MGLRCLESSLSISLACRRASDPVERTDLLIGTNRAQWDPGRALRTLAGCGITEGSGIMQTALRLLDRDMMDKQRALDAALGQIERAFGKGSIMKLGSREAASDVDVISTGSLGLDIALGIGGLPRGRVIEIYGPESSGKTTLALHVIAEAQKSGGT